MNGVPEWFDTRVSISNVNVSIVFSEGLLPKQYYRYLLVNYILVSNSIKRLDIKQNRYSTDTDTSVKVSIHILYLQESIDTRI